MLSFDTETFIVDEIVAATSLTSTEQATEPSERPSVDEATASALRTTLPIGERYTVDADGHYVGTDGFRVPRSYEEFITEFPNHVRNFVDRHMLRYSVADREERAGDLHVFLMSLPKVTKFRAPGFNGFANGCADRIQTFDPERSYGASKPRFLAYINGVLLRAFISMMKKSHANPIERQNNLCYLQAEGEHESPAVVSDEYLHQIMPNASTKTTHAVRHIDDNVLLEEIVVFIKQHNPELLPVFYAIADCETFVEAQQSLDMTDQLFTRARNRLQRLVMAYSQHVTPQRQRKLYRPRVRHEEKVQEVYA